MGVEDRCVTCSSNVRERITRAAGYTRWKEARAAFLSDASLGGDVIIHPLGRVIKRRASLSLARLPASGPARTHQTT